MYFRFIKWTQQERRMTYCDQCKEYDIEIRGRRKIRSLPNPWLVERCSSRYDIKSWKEYRKTQYKPL